MTAICYDGKTLSADSNHYRYGFVIYRQSTKLFEWDKGWFGTSGAVQDGEEFKDWLEGGKKRPAMGKGFEALWTDGDVVLYCDQHLKPEIITEVTGIGSAGTECETLMRLGYTGEKAIKKCMTWRVDIGGKVDVVTL